MSQAEKRQEVALTAAIRPRNSDVFATDVRARSVLLKQLDGRSDEAQVCAAFEHRFDEPLSPEDLEVFLEMAAV